MYNNTVDCWLGEKQFQMRKCMCNNLWSVLLKQRGKWEHIFLVSSIHPPLKWICLLYYHCTHLSTPLDYRRFMVTNKIKV
jgi:hypothetical protein